MSTKNETKKPSVFWLLIFVVLFMVFMLVQLPASWLIKKFLPEQQIFESVSGNVWRGQAQWRLPEKISKNNVPVTGTIQWQWRAWEIIWLQLGMNVHVTSTDSDVKAKLALTSDTWHIADLSGDLSANFLKKTLPLQWPNTGIQLQNIELKHKYKGDEKDWLTADGGFVWAGGEVGYINHGKLNVSNMPPLQATLELEKQKLHLGLVNNNEKRMGDFYLDNEMMVDIQLTHRLLLNTKSYTGSAGMDTVVVELRQPLSSLGQ